MDAILETIANEEALILALTLGPLVLISVLAIVRMCCRTAMETTRQREETRREIAAYVAEGSITSQEAERMLQPRPWYADTFNLNCFTGGKNGAAARPANEASSQNV